VVEDEADVRALISRVLTAFADVSTAADGKAAVAQLASPAAPPDLIITDVMMPVMDGLELVRWLKQHPQLGRLPVVVLTARGRPADMIEGINAGARSYLTKPFKPDELVARVKKLLGLPK
jgi:DNA-binding response OmpR family regulator